MAYDEGLAERIRDLLGGRRDVTEKAMFGGLAFLVPKGMVVGITGHDLMARVGPEAHAECLLVPHVRPMDFTGRPMRGYVFVGAAALASKASLGRWVEACLSHVSTLPAKAKRKPAPRTTGKARPRRQA